VHPAVSLRFAPAARDVRPQARGPRGDSRGTGDNLCLPNRLGRLEGYWRTGPYGGFLGPQFDPVCTQAGKAGERLFQPGGIDFQQLSFTPAGATLGPDLSLDLLSKRQSLLEQLEGARPALDRSAAVRKYTHAQQQSLDLLTSERFRSALDLSREPVETRERYGRNLFGQSVLTARRLVEAGVPLVTALWDCTLESSDIALLSWDTHWDHFQACREWLLPGFDTALAALLDDLDLSAQSPDTLVLVISDSVNRQHLSLYGYPRPTTPKLEARSRQDSASFKVFRHAWSSDASTVASLNNLFHFGEPDSPSRQHLLALASAAGYQTWWISNHDDIAIGRAC